MIFSPRSMGLIQKVVLEGVSRGGLYVYRWAKNHPDTVACIYNDTPVCDFKSWPGAKGRARVPRGNGNGCSRSTGLRTRRKRWHTRIIPSIICNPSSMPAFPSCTSSPRTMPSSLPGKIPMCSRSVWKTRASLLLCHLH